MIAMEVMKLNAITKLNVHGKAKDWFKTINLVLANWTTLKISMSQP
jgi:hypothetical protein